MEEITYSSLDQFLDLQKSSSRTGTIFYRGQSKDYPLIPNIARINDGIVHPMIERRMLYWLKERAPAYDIKFKDDWGYLFFAHHFGMYTRLLDWTTNPLTALWFACKNANKEYDSFVYIKTTLGVNQLIDRDAVSPFELDHTQYVYPDFNNRRLIAQSGVFTVHVPSKKNSFVPLDKELTFQKAIKKVRIPGRLKNEILIRINNLGINHLSMFPDPEGMIKHLNWMSEEQFEYFKDENYTQH